MVGARCAAGVLPGPTCGEFPHLAAPGQGVNCRNAAVEVLPETDMWGISPLGRPGQGLNCGNAAAEAGDRQVGNFRRVCSFAAHHRPALTCRNRKRPGGPQVGNFPSWLPGSGAQLRHRPTLGRQVGNFPSWVLLGRVADMEEIVHTVLTTIIPNPNRPRIHFRGHLLGIFLRQCLGHLDPRLWELYCGDVYRICAPALI